MSNKIGRFEILSEIVTSGTIPLYKASEGEGGQTVALKVLNLEGLGEQAAAIAKELTSEAEASKALKSGNIAQLLGTEEIDGKFVASMEYVQGNSIATMMARNEGFSIWDLQDIVRQSCQGLDHAHTRKVVHYTFEPAKIMVTWDGSTKILGYGVSLMSAAAAKAEGAPPLILHYMSPEQVRGEAIDIRSNIFTLGSIMYEMMTERKAFDGEDAAQVRKHILEDSPTPPEQINRKLSAGLGELIVKAMAKDPAQRYQSGQELINDLEKCKNQPAAAAAKSKDPARGFTAPIKTPAVSAGPSVNVQPQTVANGNTSKAADTEFQPAAAAAQTAAKEGTVSSQKSEATVPTNGASDQELVIKARAAAAGGGAFSTISTVSSMPAISGPSAGAANHGTAVAAAGAPITKLSAATEVESPEKAARQAPKIATDPLMAEPVKTGAAKRSFSEISELPPLKEVYIAPIAPMAAESELPEQPEITIKNPAPPEKPKVPPRVIAQQAVNEIKKTPPQFFVYAIAAAALIMLLIVGIIAYRIHAGNSDDDSGPAPSAQVPASIPVPAPVKAQPVTTASVPASTPAVPVQQAQLPASAAVPIATEQPQGNYISDRPDVSVKPKHSRKFRSRSRGAGPAVVPGELTVNSTPAGAQVFIDGQKDPSWVTPFKMAGVPPGKHTINVSKPGFAMETRTLDVASGSKALLVLELASTTAVLDINSTPQGAEIWMDGRDTGRVTPAQMSLDKTGLHSFVFKKQGYLEEPVSSNVLVGQTGHVFHVLKILGVTDEIHYKKMFGGGKLSGMATVSIKTTPKGAQIAINRRMLEKNSPVDFYLNPGTYILDITMSGYKSIHRIINVERDGKFSLDQPMENQ